MEPLIILGNVQRLSSSGYEAPFRGAVMERSRHPAAQFSLNGLAAARDDEKDGRKHEQEEQHSDYQHYGEQVKEDNMQAWFERDMCSSKSASTAAPCRGRKPPCPTGQFPGVCAYSRVDATSRRSALDRRRNPG
jgi:hypothetical protein